MNLQPTTERKSMLNTEKILARVKLADYREVRVTRSTTHAGSVLQVGTYMLPSGDAMSGITFPESAIDEVIAVIVKAKKSVASAAA
jgi:hypothetical protein